MSGVVKSPSLLRKAGCARQKGEHGAGQSHRPILPHRAMRSLPQKASWAAQEDELCCVHSAAQPPRMARETCLVRADGRAGVVRLFVTCLDRLAFSKSYVGLELSATGTEEEKFTSM